MSPRRKKNESPEETPPGEGTNEQVTSSDGSEEIVVVARGKSVPLPPVQQDAPDTDQEATEGEPQQEAASAVEEVAYSDSSADVADEQEDSGPDQVTDVEPTVSEAEEEATESSPMPEGDAVAREADEADNQVSEGSEPEDGDSVTGEGLTPEEGIEVAADDVTDESSAVTDGDQEPEHSFEEVVSSGVQNQAVEQQAEVAVKEGQPVRQLQQIETPLGRFKKWLGGTTTVGRPLAKTEPEHAPQTPAGTEQQPVVEQVMTPQLAKKELRTLRASQRSWDTLIADREQKAAEARELMEQNERKTEALSEWITNFDRSYQWRVQQRMDQQLQRAEADLRAYEDSVKNVEEFEPGRLSELRRSFHRLIRQIFAVTLPIAIATVAIPISFRIPKLDALETFYDPRLSAPIITLVVLAIIAAIFLFRRATGKDTVKNLTIVKWILVTVGIGMFIVALPLFEDDLRNVLSPYLEANQNRILTALGIIVALWIVLALAIYYRGWSQYRRAIDTQLAKLQAVISGYVETQQEVNRLGLLYKQTSEWLRILAFSLYRPWVTPAEWEEEKHTESEFRDFPFALRVAQVDDQAGAKSAELERIIASKLLVQGWRANAFRDLVDEVRRDMGVAAGKFSVEALDKDLPHQTNNTRNLLRNYLETAAKSAEEGETTDSTSTAFLVEVARKRLLDLIEQTQSVALSAARPPVNQIISDPLDDLVNDAALLQGVDESENWDNFLKESLGTDEIIQPPLSILNFTPDGQMNKVGESPKTFVLIPQRLADALPGGVAESVNLVPVTDNSSRAVEIIARVDVVGPVKPADIRLLSPNSQRVSAMAGEQRDTGAKLASLCQDCFDPTCPASIDPRAACSSGGL